MVEKLETRSAPALNAFVRGSSARLCSSNKLGWDGVYLEHHRLFPVERNDSVSTHHLVVRSQAFMPFASQSVRRNFTTRRAEV